MLFIPPKTKRILLAALLLITSSFTLLSCAGGIPGGGGLTNPNPATRDDNGGGGSKDPGFTGDDPGDGAPVGSFPMPSFKSQALVGYACDSGSACAVTGTSDASKVAFTQNGEVVAYYKKNQDVMFASYQPRTKSSSTEFSTLLGLNRWLLPLANAFDVNVGGNVDAGFDPNQLPDPNAQPICERPDVYCAQVVNGEFEAFPIGTNDSTFHYFATNGIQVLGEVHDIQPEPKLLYFADAPSKISNGNDAVEAQGVAKKSFVLSGGAVKEVAARSTVDGTRFTVEGNHRNRYHQFDAAGASDISYDPATQAVGLLKPDEGVELRHIQNIQDQGVLKTIPNTLSYDILKLTDDGKMRFAISPNENADNSTAAIYYAFDGLDGFDQNLQINDKLEFLHRPLPNQGMSYEKTLAFAVDSQGCGLTVYRSTDQQVRMRGACQDSVDIGGWYAPFSGEESLQGVNENTRFEDLIIYDTNKGQDLIITGKALLVDSGNNKVWTINYRVVPVDDAHFGDPILGSGINNQLVNGQPRQVLADAVDLGMSPKSLVLSQDKSIAYAINQDDDSLTAFRLKDQTGKVLDTIARISATKVTVPLKNLVREDLKTRLESDNTALSPNTLARRDVDAKSYLIIGLEGLKGGLVIDSQQIQPLEVPAPAPVVSKEQAAPAPSVDCAALLTQLSKTKDPALYSKLKTQYIAAGCK